MCYRMSKMYLYDPTCLNFARRQREQIARKYNGGEYFPFIQYDLNLYHENEVGVRDRDFKDIFINPNK